MTCRTVIVATIAALMFLSAAPAQVIVYNTTLAGANEDPPNASPGTGTAAVTIDTVASTMRVETTFSGLLGTVTMAHIHCCTVVPGAGNIGVATQTPTFSGFPSGVTSGMYDMTFDLTNTASYNGAFVTNNGGTAAGAMNALLTGLSEGRAYLNIHTSMFGGGEIRGFLVPEPASGLTAAILGLGMLGLRRRSRM